MVALPLIALAGYGGFLSATFGWRTVRAKRTQTGPSWRKPVSRADAVGETACLAGCCLSLTAPLVAIVGLVEAPHVDWVVLRSVASVACAALGAAIAVSAQRDLGEQWRAGVEASASLVTTGAYARVRNPFYVGCFFASAAVLVAVPSAVALAGFALHVVAAEVIVRAVEEPLLSRVHGDDFARYKARTGRFVPRLNF